MTKISKRQYNTDIPYRKKKNQNPIMFVIYCKSSFNKPPPLGKNDEIMAEEQKTGRQASKKERERPHHREKQRKRQRGKRYFS